MKLTIVLACCLLAGCQAADMAVSGANTYAASEITAVQKNVQGLDDNTARSWADVGCAIPYGAVARNNTGNPNFARAVMLLCGLPAGTTVIQTQTTPLVTTTLPAQTVAPPTPAKP